MFKGKTVLVTGASQGIGKVIALKFASLNANVAINDIAAQKENLEILKEDINKNGGNCQYFLADVSNYQEVEKMMEDINKTFGGLDVLINNAGICRDRTLAKMSEEEWQAVIDVDLKSVFNCSKNSLPLIIPRKGRIINLSSIVGERGNFGQTNYSAAKAGVIGFTKSLAKEVGRFNVTVNAICPGFIETNLTKDLNPEMKMMIQKLTALARFGKPEEIAELAVFLASEKASFITGAAINIDGGLSL